MCIDETYDDNDDYLDNDYFFDKWKKESEEYFDNLDNINKNI